MKQLIIFIFLLIPYFSISQNCNIDSLQIEASHYDDEANYGKVFTILNKLKGCYHLIGDSSKAVTMSLKMADVSRSALAFSQGITILDNLDSNNLIKSDKNRLIFMVVKGSIYYEIPEKDSAQLWARKGIEWSYKIDDNTQLGLLYNLLGSSYLETNSDSAIKYLKLSSYQFFVDEDTSSSILALAKCVTVIFK